MGASHFCRNTLTPSCVKNSKFLFPSSPSLDLHLHNWDALNNLAVLHCEMDDFQKAKTLYWQALEINEVKLGKHHLRYAATLNNLALLQVATDHPHDALRLMQEEAKIENQVLGQIFSISSDVQRLIYL